MGDKGHKAFSFLSFVPACCFNSIAANVAAHLVPSPPLSSRLSNMSVVFAVAGYATCSSLMLIVNKLTVHFVPAPAFNLFMQLMASAVIVKAIGFTGIIKVDSLVWHKAKSFALVAMAFLAVIFANMKTLQYCNVETFIVVRASTPLFISIGDYWFLGRELPSFRSWICLGVLLFGSFCYALTDSGFHVTGYLWAVIWYAIFSFDQLYIKHVVDTVKVDSNWGRVFYSNFIAALPLTLLGGATGEFTTLSEYVWTIHSVGIMILAMALGCAMSYFAFKTRSLVSATSFTIIGNVCKIVTVLINIMIWDKHASPTGLVCLFLCLGAAYMYEQAPMRNVLPTKANFK